MKRLIQLSAIVIIGAVVATGCSDAANSGAQAPSKTQATATAPTPAAPTPPATADSAAASTDNKPIMRDYTQSGDAASNKSDAANNQADPPDGKVVVHNYTQSATSKKAAKPAGPPVHIDQSKYKTPKAMVMAVPKGELQNPYDPHDKKIAKEGHALFMNHGCSGCHGGDGGGGMCPPLTDDIWSYGDKPDTLYRLVTLGTKELQAKFGYKRNAMQTMKAQMPPMGPSFGTKKNDLWKIITWVESKHLNDQS